MKALSHRLSQSPALKTAIIALVLMALLLTAVSPLLSLSGDFPKTHDGLHHLYRLIALDYSVQHGNLWPRFSPGLIFGYGSPVFHYVAPSSLFIPELLHLLGLSFKKALLTSLIVYSYIGMVGAFLLGKSLVQKTAQKSWQNILVGLSSAIAYAYAPYVLYNLNVRGSVAEIFALALLPWVLWGFQRFAASGRRLDFVLTFVLFAIFIPTHNITTMNGGVLLILFCAYLWWTGDNRQATFLRLLLAGLVAVGLTTFFWLPAVGEIDYANISNASGVGMVDFHNHFQHLAQTFALPPTIDPTQMNAPETPRSISWPQLGILVLGAIVYLAFAFRFKNGEQRVKNQETDAIIAPAMMALFAISVLIIVVLVFLTTRASVGIWETIPVIHYTQFPWRLLGLVSLILAVLVGRSIAYLATRIHSRSLKALWIIASLSVMVIYAMPWLYARVRDDEVQASTIVDTQNFERETGQIATGSFREYIPAWSTELPDPDRLTPLFSEQDIIPRLQPNPDITVTGADWGITSARIEFEASRSTTLIFDWLYFPGWRVQINEEKSSVYPLEPSGLIAVDVPAGLSSLDISMGPTPLRSVASVISLSSLALGVGLLFISRLWEKHPAGPFVPEKQDFTVLALAAVCGILLVSAKVLWIDKVDSPIRRVRFSQGVENGVQSPVLADFAQQIRLIGIDLPQSQVPSGDSLPIDLYWQLVNEQIEENYSSIIYVYNAEGTVVFQNIAFHPGDYPTADWISGSYVQEKQTITLPAGLPPGQYAVHAALFSHLQQATIAVFSADNRPLGVTVKIADFTVTRPEQAAQLSELDINKVVDTALNEQITLLGSNDLPAAAEVGQPFELALYFEAREEPAAAYHAQLLWLTDGQIAASSPIFSPLTGYHSGEWLKGDIWLGNRILTVPGRLESGFYEVALQLINPEGEQDGAIVTISQMDVSVPERLYEQPEPTFEADLTWQNGLHLIGYDLPVAVNEGEEILNLAFYWKTENDIFSNLKFFVHLLNEQGEIIAQADRIPLEGSRPTAGWSPEEFVTDFYQLPAGDILSPGQYTLRIGWYDPNTTLRIPLLEQGDFWIIPVTIRVEE